jgi:hypothetical protein
MQPGITSAGRAVRTTVSNVSRVAWVAGMTLLVTAPAFSQTLAPPRVAKEVSLSGPRIGVTFLSERSIARLREYGVEAGPLVSQFGWQFERRFYTSEDGLSALTEWVPLVGGLDQGLVLPSLNWLVGIRTGEGTEFGVGPNINVAGVGLAVATGATFRAGALNVPVNIALVTSRSGVRMSVLTGFTLRR